MGPWFLLALPFELNTTCLFSYPLACCSGKRFWFRFFCLFDWKLDKKKGGLIGESVVDDMIC